MGKLHTCLVTWCSMTLSFILGLVITTVKEVSDRVERVNSRPTVVVKK